MIKLYHTKQIKKKTTQKQSNIQPKKKWPIYISQIKKQKFCGAKIRLIYEKNGNKYQLKKRKNKKKKKKKNLLSPKTDSIFYNEKKVEI